jgi:hypothetical protein
MRLAVLILGVATLAGAAPRVRLGGIVVSAGYSRYSGFYYPYYYYYHYPFWDYWAFYPAIYWTGSPDKGEIRLRALPKAEVYLDGAYAGYAADLKTFWLKPGAYNLEIKTPERSPYSRRIYILTGKTLRIEVP